ncbi:MAG: M23 family peptidase [Bacteroidetes bacterium]|nr:MAG: M23 family peptidase [Bacteroidota bacterium]REK05108.1 MAG: M23 family peptidase [Bacteroidota bacterium]REK49040.1 MAG: M23 family peptidase [Bacteroidota bacterium]
MPKVKYHFNTSTLKYERVVVSWKRRLSRFLGWFATAVVFGVLTMLIAYNFFDSPKEKRLKRQLEEVTYQFELLKQRAEQVEVVLADIQERDNTIYRVIFEAEPIPSSIREAGYGGIDHYKSLRDVHNSEIVVDMTKRIDKLSKQLYIQSKSYDEVWDLVKNKANMLSSIPAIQPVANKDMKRVASGYGMRMHPIYKTVKMHTGMDFTAPVGTEVYATGNGTVSKIEFNGRGYGHNVIISHGYGYETLYGHLSKMTVKPGQKVKRGDVIGFVGNSGTSTGPHLHYEVRKGGTPVNPVNYYFNDLTPEEYEIMLEISSRAGQSFD